MIVPIIIGVDPAGGVDMTLIERINNEIGETLFLHSSMLTPTRYTTAAEVVMRVAEADKRLRSIFDGSDVLRMLGAPRRPRWDQHGSYHRRMLKKWTKRTGLFRP